MTIKQALKYKNKLGLKIQQAFSKVALYNSVEEGQIRPYHVEVTLDEYFTLTKELIELKTKIHTANQSVYHKIFELSELKSQVSRLKDLDCSEGKVRDRYHRLTDDAGVIKTAIISIARKDSMIETLEALIEKLQDELDVHNATTNI